MTRSLSELRPIVNSGCVISISFRMDSLNFKMTFGPCVMTSDMTPSSFRSQEFFTPSAEHDDRSAATLLVGLPPPERRPQRSCCLRRLSHWPRQPNGRRWPCHTAQPDSSFETWASFHESQ